MSRRRTRLDPSFYYDVEFTFHAGKMQWTMTVGQWDSEGSEYYEPELEREWDVVIDDEHFATIKALFRQSATWPLDDLPMWLRRAAEEGQGPPLPPLHDPDEGERMSA